MTIRERVKKMVGAGMRTCEIADALGVSRPRVSAIRRELGLPVHSYVGGSPAVPLPVLPATAEIHDRVRQLISAGKRPSEIADALGISRPRVSAIKHTLGLGTGQYMPRPITDTDITRGVR